MQKNRKLKLLLVEAEEIKLQPRQEDNKVILSYAQLLKAIRANDKINIDDIIIQLNKTSFIEDAESIYQGYPIKVLYKQLPIIVKGKVFVKVVLFIQADSLAIIFPQNVKEIGDEIEEDPSLLKEKNINLSLYAEIYNFDEKDKEFIELIKTLYLSAGNSLRAFDTELEPKDGDKKEEEDKDIESLADDFSLSDSDISSTEDSFPETEEPIDDFEEVEENKNAYKKFSKYNKFLEALDKKLFIASNSVFKENTKVKFLNENKNILVIEVNNNNIYNKYKRVPLVAKKSLTAFGEAIRKNKNTQLIDSFIRDGKRYFIVAEAAGSNFWTVEGEEYTKPKKDMQFIHPIKKDIINLKRSSIRKESRKYVPLKSGNKLVFKAIVD